MLSFLSFRYESIKIKFLFAITDRFKILNLTTFGSKGFVIRICIINISSMIASFICIVLYNFLLLSSIIMLTKKHPYTQDKDSTQIRLQHTCMESRVIQRVGLFDGLGKALFLLPSALCSLGKQL